MLKKLVALVLTTSLILGISVMQVSAEGYGTSPLGTTIFYVENGWNVYSDEQPGEPMPNYIEIGSYCFISGYHMDESVGLFAEKNGQVLLLEDAFELGEVTDLDSFYQAYLEYNNETNKLLVSIARKGDANKDTIITIEDSLQIQKVVAKLQTSYIYAGAAPAIQTFNTMCHDYNDDGVITIADVVGTQLYLARK